MPTVYSTLSYSDQRIYVDLQSKIESYATSCEYQGVTFETISRIYKAVLDDHPEYFWLSGASKGTTTTRGSTFSVAFRPEFRNSASSFQIRTEKVKFDYKVTELISMARRRSSNTYEQILFLHDYLVLNTDYCLNASHCYDAYGCLILGQAVCAGYAAAFHVLMNKLGVECGRVRGNASSSLTGDVSHAWNYIRLPDGYYYVDVTWDDPIVSGGSNRDNLSHDYFCISFDEIRTTHRFLQDQFIPRSSGSRYGYYNYFGLYAENYSFEVVKAIAQRQLARGNTFTVKFGSRLQMKQALNDLIDNQRIYSIPGVSNRVLYSTSKSELVLEVTNR